MSLIDQFKTTHNKGIFWCFEGKVFKNAEIKWKMSFV